MKNSRVIESYNILNLKLSLGILVLDTLNQKIWFKKSVCTFEAKTVAST